MSNCSKIRAVILPVLFMGMFCSAGGAAETTVTVPAQNPNYPEIFEQFDASFNGGFGASLDDNTTGTLAWLESYHLLGMMQQYRATSETKWLDKIVTHFDRVLQKRDDRLGRKDVHTSTSLKGWGTATYDKAGWHVYIVHTGMVCQGPAEFVREIKSSPSLQDKFGKTADRFLVELEAMVADAEQFWREDAATGEGYYIDPGMAGTGVMPLNMVSAMATVCVELYHITGKEQYRDKATKFATYFKNCLRDNGAGGYNWAYWPKTSKDKVDRGEDISHAALNVDFARRCAAAGIVFTHDDMVKFANTWLRTVRKPGGGWAAFVDGSGSATEAYVPQANGRGLLLLTELPGPLARQMYDDCVIAFKNEAVKVPSRGLGVANLGLFGLQW